MVFGLCLVGVALLVLVGCCLFCLPLFFVSAWWNRGIADEVTMASFCKAVTGTAVMARSANEEKKNRHVLHHPSKVLYDPETEPLFLPLFWFYPIYREMLNSASRHRPSKSMELRRAASGLVKVICRTEDSRPGGRGKKPGKPKQKGLLASFEEWFGSINMMNILYVWFPASWGPSVVEAIQTRNVTCLAKKPIVRDPHIFDRKEAARGSRAREVTCRIQKWNIKAEGFHPILVANARVDWLAMEDEDITKKFPILLEGILQDVYSQRAVSAWQGAQPQKLTVSMLLPGTSSAAEWRELLQSRRQFWPTLTTRHASLVPVSVEALQRERRQMQAKHLWYNVNIRWSDLKDKLEVLAPTGLTRDDLAASLPHKAAQEPL